MAQGTTRRFRRTLLGAALAGVCVGALLDRVVVSGVSMAPALVPGDRLLVLRTRRVRAGDVVVLRDPCDPERELVKRLARITPAGGLVCYGDNADASTDSRAYGPLPATCLVGRAVYRYAPPTRAGRRGPRR
jgi:nickel-type superoxide dismutase maturation protease